MLGLPRSRSAAPRGAQVDGRLRSTAAGWGELADPAPRRWRSAAAAAGLSQGSSRAVLLAAQSRWSAQSREPSLGTWGGLPKGRCGIGAQGPFFFSRTRALIVGQQTLDWPLLRT